MSTQISKKLEYWEHQLLDLGKRNRMINYRERGRSTLRLTEPALGDLYRRLACNEETLTFRRPIDRETDVRVYSILSLMESLSSPLQVLIGDIGAAGSIQEQRRTLKNLRAKTRLAQEEQGTHILYLSFGFIEWREGKGAGAQWIKSPLILVPAVLALDALNAPYTLKKHEDDIVINPTLEYYLKTEYGIELPPFDPDEDSPEDYFAKLEEIADKRGWRILREVSLGLLSFLKISMYNDLLRNRQRMEANPVIRAMAGDPAAVNEIPEQLHNFELDSISPRDSYQVMSADSSQQDAILYSRHGVSFVMQGPPGTGKSQTITNIIAEALAAGKKVLFVSEKMAALQVVYRRLEEACLGDFCLPLHSYKANKKEVLAQIGANLNLKKQRVKDAAIANLEELLAIRKELNQYADQLHELNPQLNFSCYEVYSKLEAVCDAATVTFTLCDPLAVTPAGLQAYQNTLEEYQQALERLAFSVRDNPWQGLSCRDTSYAHTSRLEAELTALVDTVRQAAALLKAPAEAPRLGDTLRFEDLPELAGALDAVCRLPLLPESWLEKTDLSPVRSIAAVGQSLCAELAALQASISAVFTQDIYSYDYNGWKAGLLAAAENLTALPLLQNRESDWFVEEVAFLQQHFGGLKAALLAACRGFDTANGLLGTELPVNGSGLSTLQSLSRLMTQNTALDSAWLSADLQQLQQQATEARAVTARLLQLKETLLQNWEPEILTLSYAPMLLRYKTDYTGFLRLIRPQYWQDRRQLQALSRRVLTELPDTLAVAVLQQLKEYHEKLGWLHTNATRLEKAFGSHYAGADTQWDAVLNALEVCGKLRTLPAGSVTDKLLGLLSVVRSPEEARLQALLPELEAAFERADTEISALQALVDLHAPFFDGRGVIEDIDRYLEQLSHISRQTEALQAYLTAPTPFETVYRAIGQLNRCAETREQLAGLAPLHTATFGHFYTGETTDWDGLLSALEAAQALNAHRLFSQLQPLINLPADRRQQPQALIPLLKTVHAAGQAPLAALDRLFAPDAAPSALPLFSLLSKLEGCLANIDAYPRWVDYLEAREKCCEAGLEDFISGLEQAGLTQDITRSFLKGFYHMWLGAVCDKSAAVRRFRRNAQEQRIEKFIQLDDLQLRIAQQRIRETLIDGLPSAHRLLRATDEVAILEKELAKRRNIMPLRKLFRMIPNLLMKLKPCLMMSPLSVSYFLEAESYHFDLVIFDEASQIFPEDAIGAIFRGSQVIIAGDSKQLPPTNFFATATNNADGEYDLDEEAPEEAVSDSILEESASVLPNRTLRWHYRSKHEDLIAFSNHQIYQNQLITFPGSRRNAPDMGVEYIYVADGVYDRAGRKNNLREAEECVRLVFEHIEKHPDRSLGIIAFSESQQAAIEEQITARRERQPQYEWFFDESRDEPFFIKNLENVQGDERDTILFSICYGKDKNGNMYMNFGPVGHSGGERRLNVAVTRAKCNIKLVGSILPSDIDLNRAKSEGARMLRAYIEYARKGSDFLPSLRSGPMEAEDAFCEVVARFLEDQGYQLHRRVGCSDYRIDIGVEDPANPGDFIAGIECDGLSYIQAKTARDRDHLRRSVLQSMGWQLYRVWSTEWSRNPQAEKQALLAFLAELQKDGPQKPATQTPPAVDTPITEEAPPETVSQDNPYGFAWYEEANWEDAPGRHRWDTDAQLLYVVRMEQPIHLDVLYRRLAPALRCSKVTDDLRLTVDHTLRENRSLVTVDSDQFVRLLPLTPITVRIPRPGDAKRPMEYIHTEEVAEAMMQILRHSFGLTEEALCAECARVFGYERMGPNIRAGTEAALAFLKATGRICLVDQKLQLTD